MKLLIVPVLAISLLSSCQKEEELMTRFINVELKPNESYSYNIDCRGDFNITQQPSHAQESKLTVTKSNRVYEYTPANNYSGTDQVVISNGSAENEKCDKNNASISYVFSFTVKAPPVQVRKNFCCRGVRFL